MLLAGMAVSDAPILKLPMELLELIGTNLDVYDLYQSVLVSIAWNDIFLPFLYRSATIKSASKCTRFIKLLEISADTTKKRKEWRNAVMPGLAHNLGSCLLNLNVTDSLMTSASLDKLAALCPNLRSISFRWENYFEKYMNYTSRTRSFRTPVLFFDRIHPSSLRTLTLKARSISKVARRPNVVIFTVLRHFPQLEELTVMDESLVLRIKDLEELHAMCPCLNFLRISDANMDEHDTTVSDSDIITPAITQHLSLLSYMLWRYPNVCQGAWFRYLVRKYPSLKTLGLHRPRPDLFHLSEGPGRMDATAVMPLKRHFPHLSAVSLDKFCGAHVTELPELLDGLQHVTVYSDTIRRSLDWSNSDGLKSMTKLSLPWIPINISVLSRFTCLRELCFGPAVRLESWFQTLVFDDWLPSCPSLEKLEVTQYIVSCKSVSPIHSALKVAILDLVVIKEDDMFTKLMDRCPQLSQLQIFKSRMLMPASSNRSLVSVNDIPPNRFLSLNVSRRSKHNEFRSDWY